jgi:hypothetical protein
MGRLKRITFIASLVGMLITAMTFAGCSHEAQVEDILNNIDKYYGRKVIIEGETTDSFWMPEYAKGGYQIVGGETGTRMWVFTTNVPPKQGEVVKLAGIVDRSAVIGNRVLEPIIIESDRRTIYQYPYPLVSSCPLAVYLDHPQVNSNEPVPIRPVPVTGWVNKPKASVTVNGVAVQVNSDGDFAAELQIREGNNIIQAVAMLDNQLDTMSWTVMVDKGNVIFPPGQGLHYLSQLRLEHLIEVESGWTKINYIDFETRKEFRETVKYAYTLTFVGKEYSKTAMTLPEGLNVTIKPPWFIGCPNNIYRSSITVDTKNTLAAGDYWFLFEQTSELGGKTTTWINVRVQN